MNHLMTDENRKIIDSIMKGVTVEDLDALIENEKIEKDEYCWWVEELVCALSKSKLDVYSDYTDPKFTNGWESPETDTECAIYAGISYAIQDMYRLRDGIPSAFRIYHDWFDMGLLSRLGEDSNTTPRTYTPVDAYNTYLCSICNILVQKLLHEEPTLYLFMCEMDMKIDEVIKAIKDLPNEFVYSFSYQNIVSYLEYLLFVVSREIYNDIDGNETKDIKRGLLDKMTSDDKAYLARLEDRFDAAHQKIADDVEVKLNDVSSEKAFDIIMNDNSIYSDMFHQRDNACVHEHNQKVFLHRLKETNCDLYEVAIKEHVLVQHLFVKMTLKGEYSYDELVSERKCDVSQCLRDLYVTDSCIVEVL